MKLLSKLKATAFTACLLAPVGLLAQGMGSMNMPKQGGMHAGSMVAPSQVLDKLLSGEEKEIVSLAEAMPADRFNFAPTDKMGKYDGVRTFAQEVKHLTTVNYAMFQGWNVPGAKSRQQIAALTSRDSILSALKDSFAYAHQAFGTITPQNAFEDMGNGNTRMGSSIHLLAHANDHYGQLVEYLRMNGEVPPASRKQSSM